jgi:hypothetical protein
MTLSSLEAGWTTPLGVYALSKVLPMVASVRQSATRSLLIQGLCTVTGTTSAAQAVAIAAQMTSPAGIPILAPLAFILPFLLFDLE